MDQRPRDDLPGPNATSEDYIDRYDDKEAWRMAPMRLGLVLLALVGLMLFSLRSPSSEQTTSANAPSTQTMPGAAYRAPAGTPAQTAPSPATKP
jgi:hypothetical protein